MKINQGMFNLIGKEPEISHIWSERDTHWESSSTSLDRVEHDLYDLLVKAKQRSYAYDL